MVLSSSKWVRSTFSRSCCLFSSCFHGVKRARWRLLGHILRLPDECPARMAMEYYFKDKDAKKWRGRPRTTIQSILLADLKISGNGQLDNLHDLQRLHQIAQDRGSWKELCSAL
eukprot:scpid110422/ scgid16176/ 